ncbi:MAG: hypothetical protein NTX40_10435 [Planctomycetota bacterium]|nr:hypothetical protein [Planctomycetota bacterium]
MSTAGGAQAGQSASSGGRQEPQAVIRESAKYRRRAQEAERRAEALEAELEAMRGEREEESSRLGADLTAARSEAEDLRGRVEAIERDRRLEREFLSAGCADVEAAVALARHRLAGQEPPEDLKTFARALLAEKPHLRGEPAAAAGAAARGLGPCTTGVKPAGASGQRRVLDRLADQARQTGNVKDVMTYMRARRGGI